MHGGQLQRQFGSCWVVRIVCDVGFCSTLLLSPFSSSSSRSPSPSLFSLTLSLSTSSSRACINPGTFKPSFLPAIKILSPSLALTIKALFSRLESGVSQPSSKTKSHVHLFFFIASCICSNESSRQRSQLSHATKLSRCDSAA